MSLETELSPKYRDMFLDPIFQNDFMILSKHLIKTNPEYRAEVKDIVKETYDEPEFIDSVDYALIDSNFKLPARISELEKITGIYKFLEFEEHVPTIPERIEALEKNTVLATEKPEELKTPVPLINPKTSAEKKAVAFAEWLFKKPYYPTGVIGADDKEIKEFINAELPEKLRGKDKNDRKIKERIINKAKELYPNIIEITKNANVRHETRVHIKNSYQSSRTVRTSLMLAGEML